ncbi:MAG: lipase [Myxococcota bacterium]
MLRRRLTLLLTLGLTSTAWADLPPLPPVDAGPPLTVAPALLEASLRCTDDGSPWQEPVILVHGTSVLPEENWGWVYLRTLSARGLQVCTVALPVRALGDIQEASQYVVHAIRTVHARTGRRVDVLGHSQGGLEPRWALKWWPDTRDMVDDLVTLATPHHGSWLANVLSPLPCALKACLQMRRGSSFLEVLNRDDETPGAIDYTSLYSITDHAVLPASGQASALLEGAVNLAIQDVCPGRVVMHLAFAWDPVVVALVVDALTHPGGVDPARLPKGICRRMEDPTRYLSDVVTRDYLRGVVRSVPLLPPTFVEPRLAPYVVVDRSNVR